MQAPPKPKPRVISAAHTALLKWGLPGFFLWEWLWYMVSWARMHRLHVPTPPALVVYIIVNAALCLWVGWSFLGLKHVAYTDTELHVSNFRRQIVVPLSDVAALVRDARGGRARPAPGGTAERLAPPGPRPCRARACQLSARPRETRRTRSRSC